MFKCVYRCEDLPDNDTGSEVEVLLNDIEQFLLTLLGGAIVEDGDGEWVGHSDGIRHLNANRNTTCKIINIPSPFLD